MVLGPELIEISMRPSHPLLEGRRRRRIVDHGKGRSRHRRDHLTVDSTTQLLIPPRTKSAKSTKAPHEGLRASIATTVSPTTSVHPAVHDRRLTDRGRDCSSLQAGSRGSKIVVRPGLSEWLAMSSREVTNWLQSHRLGAYVDVFAEHDVTWDDLGELGDEDLRKMGLKTRERRRLLQAIAYDYLVGGGERKQLTVLYYDLVQSVTLSNLIGDPEAFLEIVRSIHAKFEVLLSRLGGTKYQMEGDGAWYLFGWPAIEGNPAARSAHAAFAIMQAARELKLPVPAGWVLQFRVTIASDLMVIMPTKREGEVEVAGNAINLAARLKRVCRPGSIVIDRATRDRFGRAFHVAALGLQSFEGIEGKVEAFVLGVPRSGLTTFAARKAARSRPLVGRDAELAQLRKQWLLACEGHGQVGFLVGTAGIGKSRLALALSHLAAEQHGTVLSYQCSDLYRSSALYPLLDRLRRDARIRHLDLTRDADRKAAQASRGPRRHSRRR